MCNTSLNEFFSLSQTQRATTAEVQSPRRSRGKAGIRGRQGAPNWSRGEEKEEETETETAKVSREAGREESELGRAMEDSWEYLSKFV